MNNKPSTGKKTLKNLRLWWMVVSGTTLRIFAIVGAISVAALIAIGSFSGFNASEVNAKNAEAPKKNAVPQLVLIDKKAADNKPLQQSKNTPEVPVTDNALTEIPASGKGDKTFQNELNTILSNHPVGNVVETPPQPAHSKIVVAQAATAEKAPSVGLQLKDLVNKAMNPSTESEPAKTEETAEAKPVVDGEAPKSTNDLLKALVGSASNTPSESGQQDYISSLTSESENTVVIDEQTAQKPAESTLSNSDRIKLIQNIASRVAEDSDETADNVEYVTIEENDSLWLIAKRLYNDPYKYKLLYSANRDILLNENSLIVGQKLRAPKID